MAASRDRPATRSGVGLTDTGSFDRADGLRAELESLGLILLAVSSHRTDPDLFTVYLHGAAAQWVNGEAMRLASTVPGVLGVVESVQSPAIILVRFKPSEPD